MGLRERLGEQFPMPGEWWWLLWKCMLRTRQQVLQVTLGGESQVVPCHPGHQVRLVSMGLEQRCNVFVMLAWLNSQQTASEKVDWAAQPCDSHELNGCRVCRAPPCMHRSSLLFRFHDALMPASLKNDCVEQCASRCLES